MAVQFFSNGATYATIVPRLPEIREQVGISIGTLGLVLTIGSLGGLVGTLLTGPVIARVGSRRVMVYGATVSLAFLPVIGFTTSPAILAVALFGLLFFDIFIDVAMNVQGSAISARRHTPVMNRLHGLWSLGSVAGGVVTVLTLRAGVSTEVQLTLTALVLIVALRIMAPGLLHRDEAPELEKAAAAVAERPHIGRFGFATMLLAAGGATAMAIELTNGDWASFRLGDDLGASPGVAASAFLTFTAAMTIGRLGGDWVQVRVGPVQLMRIAPVVIAVGCVLATLIPSVPVALVGFFIGGIGTLGAVPAALRPRRSLARSARVGVRLDAHRSARDGDHHAVHRRRPGELGEPRRRPGHGDRHPAVRGDRLRHHLRPPRTRLTAHAPGAPRLAMRSASTCRAHRSSLGLGSGRVVRDR